MNVELVNNIEELKALGPFDAISCQSADEHFMDVHQELALMKEILADDGIMYISHPYFHLDKDVSVLEKEDTYPNRKLAKRVTKDYHLQHLNYIRPSIFSDMLKKHGLKERAVFCSWPLVDVDAFHPRSLGRLAKGLIRYAFDLLGIKHKKTIFFIEKA